MRQGALRIRSVKFKSGGEIRLLPDVRAKESARIEAGIRSVVETHKASGADLAGFALVVWGSDLSSTSHMLSGARSVIPSIAIPDFVRSRLLAAKISEWTQADIFGPPKPDSA